jgi:hypothetical protein
MMDRGIKGGSSPPSGGSMHKIKAAIRPEKTMRPRQYDVFLKFISLIETSPAIRMLAGLFL